MLVKVRSLTLSVPPLMKKVELVFVPAPGIGHFVSATVFAKRLLDRDEGFSVTILVIPPPGAPPEIEAMIQSLAASDAQIRYINIPPADHFSARSNSSGKFISDFIESHVHHIKNAITTQLLSGGVEVAGIVVDMFCTSMIHDVAHQLNIPSYVYFTSGAAFLGFMLFLPVRHVQVGVEFSPSDVESIVPSYANPVTTGVLPSFAFDKDAYEAFLHHATRFRQTKGFIVNTFVDLEPHAVNSMMMSTLPPIYHVGPVLNLGVVEKSTGLGYTKSDETILNWLDDQPPSSVVFLCFGSRGSFDAPQLEQMAMALERSGHRFLWSVRCPPPKDSLEMPTEYKKIQEALPDGFLERTEKRGMVCGWAPQEKILAHRATGGFVSHCGWNSIMESIWYGVPIVTWPLYAEQQLNAFELVRELGLSIELKMDYRVGSGEMVMADAIERAIYRLMDDDDDGHRVRNKVKEMSEKSKKAVVDGGSSYVSLGRLIEDVLKNIDN